MKPYKRPYGGTPGPPVMYEKPSDPEDEGAGYGYSNGMSQQERDVFYYHSDHLGSTSYITDRDGNATQFVSYKPYGEALVDEHATSFESPWKFNGKELDSKTGLYYYGARYYEPVLALWYGVDALTEKYTSVGGYVYCFSNPIHFIDPDGNAAHWVEGEDGTVYWDENAVSESTTKSGDKYLGQEGWEINDENGNIIHYESDGTTTESSVRLGDVTISGDKNIYLVRQAIYQGQYDFLTHPVTQAVVESFFWITGASSLVELSGEIIARQIAKRQIACFASFYAFKKSMGSAGRGFAWHHIVEQTPSNIARFGAKRIHNVNNIIKLPNGKNTIHSKISGFYSSKQPFTNGVTDREWLSTKSYEEQYEFGIETLKMFGWSAP